jgi:ATP-binding cassette, subfamily B (MDR/TAP), member 1
METVQAILNVRGIRSMGFESVFQNQFDGAAARALATGGRGAFVEGCTYGVASALIYLAEALLFYVGAVLMARGTYTYLRMVEVLNLVVFTVSIGSQLMAFSQSSLSQTDPALSYLIEQHKRLRNRFKQLMISTNC